MSRGQGGVGHELAHGVGAGGGVTSHTAMGPGQQEDGTEPGPTSKQGGGGGVMKQGIVPPGA